jgi:hypothetical protein
VPVTVPQSGGEADCRQLLLLLLLLRLLLWGF